ncbi:WD40 repeat domain-containing protein [Aggregatibacter aphrophilus]|uniref:WD40 repeat domain-containing protein n=1 Tax=Aggregatibacter aphrophilus TaxID=732 RepID=UPI000D65DD1C|nr:WD40 repeat domain-containing protein [Aggregatibacter aphrophilus]
MKNKFIKLPILFLLLAILLILYQWYRTDPVLSLSISTDGRYVISAHASQDADRHKPIGQLVLWDIERKEKTILARDANAFSAAFIPDSHEFMWQDHKNIVHIQNVEGEELFHFNHFLITGHLMNSNKDFYLSANEYGQLFKGYSENIVPIYTDGGIGTPLTLSMTEDYIFSVGGTCFGPNDPVVETNLTVNPINPDSSKKGSYDGVTLWDIHTLKPITRLYGNCGYTTGLISPNGDWVVTGGENFGNYMWEIHNIMNRQRLSLKFDNIPEKLKEKQITKISVIAYAFVTDTEFVALRQSGNYDGYGDEIAAVYTVGESQIKGYVEIGNDPSISTNYYQRNLSVSSSPKAHILVTGQATGGGINVYKYHPEKMELEKIWVAD